MKTFTVLCLSAVLLLNGADSLSGGRDVKLELKPDKGGVSELSFEVAGGGDKGRATSTKFSLVNGYDAIGKSQFSIYCDSLPGQPLVEVLNGIVPAPLPMPISHAVVPTMGNSSNASNSSNTMVVESGAHGMQHKESSNGTDPYDFKFRSQLNSAVSAKHIRTSSLHKAKQKAIVQEASTEQASISNGVVFSGKLLVTGNIGSTASGPVEAFGGRPQPKLIVDEDFHLDTVAGWTVKGTQQPLPADNSIGTCSSSAASSPAESGSSAHMSDFFLGPFRDAETYKSFSLPAHTRVKISARVHFLDEWTGEALWMGVSTDGGRNVTKVWSRAHKWCDKLLPTLCRPRVEGADESNGWSINVCGNPSYPDTLSIPLVVNLANTDEDLQISFGSTLKRGTPTGGPAWGIDDLRLTI